MYAVLYYLYKLLQRIITVKIKYIYALFYNLLSIGFITLDVPVYDEDA